MTEEEKEIKVTRTGKRGVIWVDVQMGESVVDSLTGFTGFVVARCEYLNGVADVGVQRPIDKDGDLPEIKWIPEPRLIILGIEKENPGAKE